MLTGREARTLPPAVVRGLFWRITVASLWDEDLIRASRTKLPKNYTAEQANELMAARKAADAITAVVFPEDDDG